MSDALEAIKIDHYWRLVLKHRWFIVIPFCLAMIAGIYLTRTLPKIYSASTLILVEPQRVPTDYVQSIVSIDIDARINTISQQIMSRTNLEKVINEFSLYADTDYEKVFMEDKIANMRKRISVDVTRDRRRGADSFSISFEGRDPEKVMKVANALASYFINENLKVREAQAVGTSTFLDSELGTMREKLEEVEETLKKYRKTYMGELPEQLESNLRILDRLQEGLGQRKETLRDARNRLEAQVLQTTGSVPQTETEGPSNIYQLQDQLANLESRYTARHPDIIKLKKQIAEMKANIATEIEQSNEDSTGAGLSESRIGLIPADMRQQREIKREIKTLEREISEIIAQIKVYEKRVEDTPKREQELMSLRRDYDNIQESYNSLLGRRLEAEIAVNMERKQKGEQFRIIDPARVPLKPISPDMRKLFIFVIAAGLGIGGGIIFLLDFFDSSFRRATDVESVLGLSVLATVPLLYQPKDIIKQKINQILSIIAVTISLGLFLGFAVLTLMGQDHAMELIKKIVNI